MQLRQILRILPLSLVAALVPLSPAWSTTTVVELVDGTSVTLTTASSGGYCLVVPLGGANGTDITCVDGGDRVKANTVTGCLFYEGRGLCAETPVGATLWGSTQLSCTIANGGSPTVYNLSTGTNVLGKGCTVNAGNSASCDDGAGNTSGANCASGCGSQQGSGCCCQVGTANCRPGNTCTGK